LVCAVVERIAAGDHAIVLAEPLAAAERGAGAPLLYHNGQYARLAEPEANRGGSCAMK
jgi:flavin reductase (DIM6/NTAB) family NADH-FMN oxidoreductase RutF